MPAGEPHQEYSRIPGTNRGVETFGSGTSGGGFPCSRFRSPRWRKQARAAAIRAVSTFSGLRRRRECAVIADDPLVGRAATARVGGVTNKVSHSTFAQLRKVDIGRWGQWQGKGFSEKIPALDEVLPLDMIGRAVIDFTTARA